MSERPNHRQGRHAAPRVHGRHRAAEPPASIDSPTNILPLTESLPVLGERRLALASERKRLVEDSHPSRTRMGAAIATTGLIFIGSIGGIGAAAAESQPEAAPTTDTDSLRVVGDADGHEIVAPKVPLAAPRTEVKTKAAPRVVETPKAAPAPVAPVVPPAPIVQLRPAPPPPAPPPAPVAGTKAGAIAAAALAQLGVYQDCTMLVTNSLAAVGIQFHDWPAGYLSLGSVVTASAAVPGDLIYYADGGMGVAHIAVYIGNGVAVHGGWNGNQTVTFSANIGSGPVFIRVA